MKTHFMTEQTLMMLICLLFKYKKKSHCVSATCAGPKPRGILLDKMLVFSIG